MKELELTLHNTKVDLPLSGVVPRFPSEKYGYIVPEGFRGIEVFNREYPSAAIR